MTCLAECARDYLAWIRHERGYAQRMLETYSALSSSN